MKKVILIILVFVVISVSIAHWYYSDRGRFTTEPEYSGLSRTVSGSDLISTHDPAATLRFDSAYQHIGGQKFILYGNADTEQHFFVETTSEDKLKSVYWVQYEAYLPGQPFSYDYDDSPLRETIDGFEFFIDTYVVEYDPNRRRRPGTDGALARQFLASKGYTFPPHFSYARLVYLTDETRKKELMIIFIDDLSEQGFSEQELDELTTDSPDWPTIEEGLLNRIRNTLTVIDTQ